MFYVSSVSVIKILKENVSVVFLKFCRCVLSRTQNRFSVVPEKQYTFHRTASIIFVTLVMTSKICKGVNTIILIYSNDYDIIASTFLDYSPIIITLRCSCLFILFFLNIY